MTLHSKMSPPVTNFQITYLRKATRSCSIIMGCFEDFQKALNFKKEKPLKLGMWEICWFPSNFWGCCLIKGYKSHFAKCRKPHASIVTERFSCLPFGMWKILCIFSKKGIDLSFAGFAFNTSRNMSRNSTSQGWLGWPVWISLLGLKSKDR